ncbi:hypothetical protein T459_16990 [Capsicum annuum]|uniref:Uncharacterized protein n=1 Tax=Capsicum annuum TaxID=4072 RepID=A0A2G2ZAB3_CAPAN|nr:hypothetical protein T459_16990 [Capsicum annuum]
MECIATKSGYTADDNFSNADAVFDCIGDSPEERFDLAFCGSLLKKQYVASRERIYKQIEAAILKYQ